MPAHAASQKDSVGGPLVSVFAKKRRIFQRLSRGKMNIEKIKMCPLVPGPQKELFILADLTVKTGTVAVGSWHVRDCPKVLRMGNE